MIHVVTDPGVGGTFLTWTLYWLSGQTQYWSQEKQKTLTLPNNPIAKVNAHGFLPNQPNRIFECTAPQFTDWIEQLNQRTNEFNVVYYHTFDCDATTQCATDHSNVHASKLIVVDSQLDILYHCSARKRAPTVVDKHQVIVNNTEQQQHFIQTYFNDSKQFWDSLGLLDVWDQREFLALNLRPFDYQTIYNHYIDQNRHHYFLHSRELWTTLDQAIKPLFQYLELDLAAERLDHWQYIYNQWRALHQQKLNFCTYFDTIVSSILRGHYFDLNRFDLDIQQEAAIQHALIYRHNLNLKTWQLDKFQNTQQLHKLLEPNSHQLGS